MAQGLHPCHLDEGVPGPVPGAGPLTPRRVASAPNSDRRRTLAAVRPSGAPPEAQPVPPRADVGARRRRHRPDNATTTHGDRAQRMRQRDAVARRAQCRGGRVVRNACVRHVPFEFISSRRHQSSDMTSRALGTTASSHSETDDNGKVPTHVQQPNPTRRHGLRGVRNRRVDCREQCRHVLRRHAAHHRGRDVHRARPARRSTIRKVLSPTNGTIDVSNTADNVVASIVGTATTTIAGSYEGNGESGDGGAGHVGHAGPADRAGARQSGRRLHRRHRGQRRARDHDRTGPST